MPALSRRWLLSGAVLMAAPALAFDNPDQGKPDVGPARARIRVKDYKGAMALLQPLLAGVPSADVYNLMGFCLRKTGDQQKAFGYYAKALELDWNHTGALEYQGELFVETGQLERARANLARLKSLCPFGCEEREDLEHAIAAAARAR